MSKYSTILYALDEKNPAICRITMNRPEKRNAINQKMATELIDAFRKVRGLTDVSVVVFGGAGDQAFCTGGDLDIFSSWTFLSAMDWLAHDGLDLQRAITGCDKVVIAKIDGYCLAGGLELALCCDLLYANESAMLGITEINMGALPGWGGTARIVRSLPIFKAREIIYSGRKDYTAREMEDMGLLTRVFADDEFDEKFEAVVANIGSKRPLAIRMGKEVMAKSEECGSIETAIALERNAIQWMMNAPEIRAVMENMQNPKDFTKRQKKKNLESDIKK